jgi:membrane fusion protein (multidrug efflux system)
MTPRAKKIGLGLGAFALVGALAIPKLLPLFRSHAAEPKSEAKADAKSGGKSGTKGSGSGRDSGGVVVATKKIEATKLSETLDLVGTLRAEEAVELQAETAGKVIEIAFAEGTRVRQGDLLLRLNDAELQAARERAEARRELARLKEERLAALLKNGGINQQDYDNARSEFAVQDAEAKLIAAQIEKTVIRAPFDGVVGLRAVSVGSFVSSSTRIASLQATDRLKLDFAVPERHAGRLKPGARVEFTVTGDGLAHTGEVYAVEPRVDEATRTVLVRARVPNPDGHLAPGALARISLALQQWDAAVLLPAMAILTTDRGKTVFVVEGGVARVRPIETGLRRRDLVQVTAGLKPGETVIVAGVQAVKDGVKVKAEGD